MLIFNFNTFSSGFHAPPSALTCVHHENVDEVLSGNSPTTNGSTAKTMVTQAISIIIIIIIIRTNSIITMFGSI